MRCSHGRPCSGLDMPASKTGARLTPRWLWLRPWKPDVPIEVPKAALSSASELASDGVAWRLPQFGPAAGTEPAIWRQHIQMCLDSRRLAICCRAWQGCAGTDLCSLCLPDDLVCIVTNPLCPVWHAKRLAMQRTHTCAMGSAGVAVAGERLWRRAAIIWEVAHRTGATDPAGCCIIGACRLFCCVECAQPQARTLQDDTYHILLKMRQSVWNHSGANQLSHWDMVCPDQPPLRMPS
jgi:hypothetical protein